MIQPENLHQQTARMEARGPSRPLQCALALAEEHGIPVFPFKLVPRKDGKTDKIPLVADWPNTASTNVEQIAEWWKEWPDAHVGVPTGSRSRLLLIDIDPQALPWYQEQYEKLSIGRTHRTTRGFHLVYRYPTGKRIHNSASRIAPGVDVRGEGGFIAWWPAQGYRVVGELEDVTDPPGWLLDLITKDPPQTAQVRALKRKEGGRNDYLSGKAYNLRRDGASVEAIGIILAAINETVCDPPLETWEVEKIAKGKAIVEPDAAAQERMIEQATPISPISLRHAYDIVEEKRESEWLPGLLDVLEQNVLAVIAGPRSTFKSFLALHWAMTAALNGTPVVMLSAEGAGLDRRIDAWMRKRAPSVDLRKLPFFALERALNLNVSQVLEELTAAIDAAAIQPGLIVIDTYSKYSGGMDADSNKEVKAFLSRITETLRARYGCTVLIVAHTGHADAKRPRGASTLMQDPDAEYIVTRPDATAMSVSVSRERFKDSPGLEPLGYTLESMDLGRTDRNGRPVTSLVPVESDAPPVAMAKPELKGKSQKQLLAALRARTEKGSTQIWTLEDIRKIGREAGLHKNTARAAAESLTFSPYFVATVGGWRLAND